MKKPKQTDKQIVLQECLEAYCDAGDMPFNESLKKRKLNFRSSRALSPADARDVARACIPHGYNCFSSILLAEFPEDCKVVIAREGSPCLYVTKGSLSLPDADAVMADEMHVQSDGSVRYWWD